MQHVTNVGGDSAESAKKSLPDRPQRENDLGPQDVLVGLIRERFVERDDVKAVQAADGSYFPEYRPLSIPDIRAHLSGERTLGHYLLSTENRCRLFAFDLDLAEFGLWEGDPIGPRVEFDKTGSRYRAALTGQLLIAAETLARVTHRELDVPVAISFSGSKGCHVYGFTGSEPAVIVRNAALDIIEACDCFRPSQGTNFFAHERDDMNIDVEVFPKQASLDGKKLGNLMRLPLGRNRRSNSEGFFVCVGGGRRSTFCRMNPIGALSGQLPWDTQ